jgi:hypothetical protein
MKGAGTSQGIGIFQSSLFSPEQGESLSMAIKNQEANERQTTLEELIGI